jgi:Family of unknown function (DUF6510)
MIDDGHLDGNALGGLLLEIFGTEMTGRSGCCGGCGAVNPLAAVLVYRAGPGTVARCPACSNILMVVVTVGSHHRVSLAGLRWLEVVGI